MSPGNDYWFPAKRYGWGWGFPSKWQGWLVLVAFLFLVAFGARLFPPGRHTLLFIASMVVCVGLLMAACWLKGEPPRWRWGS